MRFRDILQEDFEVNHRLVAYHATHEPQGLILRNREVKGMDSMGTWLSSSREMVEQTFGPNVEAYELPQGRYMKARQNQSIEIILTCLPIIKEVLGREVHDHLWAYPLSPENRKFLYSMRKRDREGKANARTNDGVIDYDHRQYLRWKAPEQLARWKALEKSERYQSEVARSAEYCRRFREMMSETYKGIVWANNVGWDGWMKPVNIYLVFNDEDLTPIPGMSSQRQKK